MRFEDDDVAAAASRVLDKCCDDFRQQGPWHWLSAVRNGTLLHVESRLEQNFLQLTSHPLPIRRGAAELERALEGNNVLPGGVGLALGADSQGLHIRGEIVLPGETSLDEANLLHRLKWTLDGFHHGVGLLKSLDARGGHIAPPPEDAADAGLAELLRESSWRCEERGPNNFAAALDADTEPLARIRMTECGLLLNVELDRADADAAVARAALSVFLLTTGSSLRMARPYAAETDYGWSFGFRVCLPASPVPEEIDHALAALSVAHRGTSRETRVLLDEAAARCYLAAREISTTN